MHGYNTWWGNRDNYHIHQHLSFPRVRTSLTSYNLISLNSEVFALKYTLIFLNNGFFPAYSFDLPFIWKTDNVDLKTATEKEAVIFKPCIIKAYVILHNFEISDLNTKLFKAVSLHPGCAEDWNWRLENQAWSPSPVNHNLFTDCLDVQLVWKLLS